MLSQAWIRTYNLCRHYQLGHQTVRALDSVDLSIHRGEFLAITGASGSGKSTLLNLLAGLDTPSSGHIQIGDQRLDTLSRRELSAYRAREVGIVFQAFNLLTHLTALRNVEMALYFQERSPQSRLQEATKALARVGLGERMHHRPLELSGGEQQRVAIARALAKNPSVLFADEPTGNLDHENSDEIAAILTELHKGGMTVVLNTHDLEMAGRISDRAIHLNYGKIQ